MTIVADVAEHEAAHVVAGELLGVPALSAQIDGAGGGRAYLAYRDRDTRRRAQVILAPLVLEERVPSWPVRSRASTDHRRLAVLVDRLGFDEDEYDQLVAETERLTFSSRFKTLVPLIATALEHHRTLSRSHLDHLLGGAMGIDDTNELEAELGRRRGTPGGR